MDDKYVIINGELYHYGVKGKSGRYPLGSGARPYQDYPTLRLKMERMRYPYGPGDTPASKANFKRRKEIEKELELRKQEKKEAKQRKKEEAKQRAEAEKQEAAQREKDRQEAEAKKSEEEKQKELDAKKEEVLKTRSAKELYKNAGLFTDAELKKAYDRLTLENNVKNLIPKDVNKGQQYLKDASIAAENISKLAGSGIKMYNQFAMIYNSQLDGDEGKLKLIFSDNNKNDKDKNKKN